MGKTSLAVGSAWGWALGWSLGAVEGQRELGQPSLKGEFVAGAGKETCALMTPGRPQQCSPAQGQHGTQQGLEQ